MAKHNGINPVVAGTAGAVIGAGIALGASTALKSKKTRARIKDAFEVVLDRAAEGIPMRTPAVRLNLAQVKHGMKQGKITKSIKKVKVVKVKKGEGRKNINSP